MTTCPNEKCKSRLVTKSNTKQYTCDECGHKFFKSCDDYVSEFYR